MTHLTQEQMSHQAGLDVVLGNLAADRVASANAAVVRALRGSVTILGEADGTVVQVQQNVLLLNAEPAITMSCG